MSEYVETEISEFPKEWEVKRLKDIVIKAKMGGTPRRNISEYWNGNIPFVKIQDMTESGKYLYTTKEFITEKGLEKSNAWIVPKDSLLLAIYGSVGSIAINKISVATNQAIVGIIPKNSIVNTEFLYYWYLYFKPYWYKFIKKGTQPNLTLGIVLDSPVPLPPLEEQKKIVETLQKASEIHSVLKDYITQARDNINSLRRKIIGELVTKGIGHEEFNETEICEFPKEWEVKRLSEIAELQRGLSYSGKEKSSKEIPDGYLFLTLNSIREGGGLKEDGWTWIKSDRLKERHFVREGDIVIANTEQSKDGSLIGSPAIVHFPEWYKKEKAVYSHHISKLTLKINKIDINFLFYYLSFAQPLARKYHTGTGVWGLNTDSWAKDLSVPIPPLEEQKKIVETLQKADELYTQLNDFLQNMENEADSLFKSILRFAVTGRLTENWRKQITLLRSLVIPYIVYQASKIKGRPVYMTELMKYLFLLQKEYNINLAYNFEPYKYGPFTPQVYRDLEDLKDKVEVKEVKDDVDKSLITSKELPQLDQNIANAINDLLNRFGNKNLKELLAYVYKKYPEYTVRSELNLDDFK
ncbi:restriction endonuclease subunit S [Saccharolobus caldissimus]|uniref:Type I restriction modification DNA specificity domain-containing protein n=1 Tax=Saccharolobus caldissimus TaxID=1702097 RepID=A0AAQ4CWU8_9CREN|nr:restriction endonuclease subunit S [Saccharolobus caldissimus]BDC00280.1 hypothetical protein SACC_32960 [Saccharolobus caldissimus]